MRTKEGGLVLEGRKFKGTFDQLPVTDKEEIMQKVDAKAHEMIPQIFEAHIAYRQLIAYQKDGRIDLINALTGKSIISHHFRVKKGYRYISSYLLNSEWWVIEGSAEAGSSMAIKYELYLNNSSPTSILHIKRVYGDIGGSLQLSGED